MNVIKISDLAKRIAISTWQNLSDVKEVLGYIVPEIKFELSQGNKITFPWVVALSREDVFQYNSTNPQYAVKNKYRVKALVSRRLKDEINFWHKKD